MNRGKAQSIISNFLWRFAERCGAQGVSFIVSIVLARMLEPSVYGIIAIVSVFLNILSVFIEGGFGNALIQKKDADDLDFSSVFYFNLLFCVILYVVMFIIAPFIAEFYKMPELTSVLRVMCIILILSGLRNIQGAYISKHLIFKKFFFSTMIGTVLAARFRCLGSCNSMVGKLCLRYNYSLDNSKMASQKNVFIDSFKKFVFIWLEDIIVPYNRCLLQ